MLHVVRQMWYKCSEHMVSLTPKGDCFQGAAVESHIWSGKYGIQSMIYVTPRFLAPPTTTWILWRWQLYCMAPPKKSLREELDGSAEAVPRHTPLSWRVRFMDHAIKDKDNELYPGESKAQWERHPGDSALQTAALVSQRPALGQRCSCSTRFCSGFVWPQDQSLLLTSQHSDGSRGLTWSKLDQQRLVP